MHSLVRQRINNPEIGSRGLAIAAFAIGGAMQGAIVGSVFTQEEWYQGLWKGALAGAAAGGVLAGVIVLADPDASFFLGGQDPCVTTWREIGRRSFAQILPAALAGAAAGAAVAPAGDRGQVARAGMAWNTFVWGFGTAALELTRKLAPRPECLPVSHG